MTTGQSITDRALAAKHTVAGQGLAKSVCKATTEEVIGPKRKHLDYLLYCTKEQNVSIPQMANLLIERTQNSSWVVVFKALVTVHNLMNYGSERFTQYLASSNCTFHLDSFYDRSNGMQGYGMSTFIRRYAKYLNQKAYAYRQMASDFCRAKRGKDDGLLRTMHTEQLIKALPILQTQFDALIEFDVSAGQLTNGVINAAFLLLFKDLIRLYASYNDGIINLLGQYFDMNKKNCREAFEIYKLFIARVENVGNFFKVAESIGVDKGDIPDLAKAPSSLLEALEQHLISLENTKKTSTVSKPLGAVSIGTGSYASTEMPYPPASSAVAPTTASSPASEAVSISEAERRRILEEEQRMFETIKQQNMKSPPVAKATPPVSMVPAAVAVHSIPTAGMLPDAGAVAQRPVTGGQAKFNPFDQLGSGFDLPPIPPSYDLLGLQQPPSVPSANGFSFLTGDYLLLSSTNRSSQSPVMNMSPVSNRVDMFGQSSFSASEEARMPSDMESAFAIQSVQTPLSSKTVGDAANRPIPVLGAAAADVTARAPAAQDKSGRLITSDLDASLATIAGNLSIRTSENYKRMEHHWSGPTEKKLTGAAGGNPWMQPSSSPASSGARPAPVTMVGMQPAMMTSLPQYPTMIPAYPVAMGQPAMMNPMTGTMMVPPGQNPTMFASSHLTGFSSTGATQPPHQSLPPNDPFGAL